MTLRQSQLAGIFALLFLICTAACAMAAILGVGNDLLRILCGLFTPFFLTLTVTWAWVWMTLDGAS